MPTQGVESPVFQGFFQIFRKNNPFFLVFYGVPGCNLVGLAFNSANWSVLRWTAF
jgi:hypothetical protein